MNKNEIAKEVYRKVRKKQLSEMLGRMPSEKQGVEFTINGITYLSFIRRLTPTECDNLQTIPDWYDWDGISETQHYKMIGNGWTVGAIKHSYPTSVAPSGCGPCSMVWLVAESF